MISFGHLKLPLTSVWPSFAMTVAYEYVHMQHEQSRSLCWFNKL